MTGAVRLTRSRELRSSNLIQPSRSLLGIGNRLSMPLSACRCYLEPSEDFFFHSRRNSHEMAYKTKERRRKVHFESNSRKVSHAPIWTPDALPLLCALRCHPAFPRFSYLPFFIEHAIFFNSTARPHTPFSFSGSPAHASRLQSAFRAPLLRSNAAPKRFGFIPFHFSSQIVSDVFRHE